MDNITQQQVGEDLLFPLFRSLSADYKQKYKRDVWDQFENNIRSSAYTARLTAFFENITRTMPIVLEQQWARRVMNILNAGEDKKVLTWLRDETTYLTLIARMKNEERKEEYKARTGQAADEDYPVHPIFTQNNNDENSNI